PRSRVRPPRWPRTSARPPDRPSAGREPTMLNRLLTSLLGAFVLAGTAAAQEPPKPEDPKPVRTETGEQKRQDPEKRGTQTPPPAGSQGQESGKTGQDPAKGSGKAGDPKTEGKDPPKATEVDLPGGGPLPAGSDPADIRALRGAQGS